MQFISQEIFFIYRSNLNTFLCPADLCCNVSSATLTKHSLSNLLLGSSRLFSEGWETCPANIYLFKINNTVDRLEKGVKCQQS